MIRRSRLLRGSSWPYGSHGLKYKPGGSSTCQGEVMQTILPIAIVGGAILGGIFLSEDWSMARRIAAGAVAGAGVALLTTAPRIVG